MQREGFLHRWSRLKVDAGADAPAAPRTAGPVAVSSAAEGTAPLPVQAEQRLPTLSDVALLNADSDYSAFVARGVDQQVRRLAMKKLFSDPHFHLVDGLDIYMGDYNRPDPVSAAMLAALQHAESFFAQATEVEAREEERAAAARDAGKDPRMADAGRAGDDGGEAPR